LNEQDQINYLVAILLDLGINTSINPSFLNNCGALVIHLIAQTIEGFEDYHGLLKGKYPGV
jgi:hypothetical protein